MTGGYMINRVLSEWSHLGFKDTIKVEVPSFDPALGQLLETNITMQVAVSVQAQCGPRGLVYDMTDFDAEAGIRAEYLEWPLQSTCEAPYDDSDIGSARRRRSTDCQDGSNLFQCGSVNCPTHRENCSVAVERATGGNHILLNDYAIGMINPGRSGYNNKSWSDCQTICVDTDEISRCSGEGKPGCVLCADLPAGDLFDRFGAYDKVSLCGTDIANNGEGIKSGDAIDYEWESPIREFHLYRGANTVTPDGRMLDEDGPRKNISDLLSNAGTETLEWRPKRHDTRDGLNDEGFKRVSRGYAPLRVSLYGPVEDLTARFQGEYCVIYGYAPGPSAPPSSDSESGNSDGSEDGDDTDSMSENDEAVEPTRSRKLEESVESSVRVRVGPVGFRNKPLDKPALADKTPLEPLGTAELL